MIAGNIMPVGDHKSAGERAELELVIEKILLIIENKIIVQVAAAAFVDKAMQVLQVHVVPAAEGVVEPGGYFEPGLLAASGQGFPLQFA